MDNSYIEEIFIFLMLFALAGVVTCGFGVAVLMGFNFSSLTVSLPSLIALAAALMVIVYKLRKEKI